MEGKTTIKNFSALRNSTVKGAEVAVLRADRGQRYEKGMTRRGLEPFADTPQRGLPSSRKVWKKKQVSATPSLG